MDTTALREVIAGLPNDEATAAIVRATGPDGCWTGTAGVADRNRETPVPPNARFRIGSVTKVFTATVVLQLAAEGKISLAGTVQEYLPGLLPADYPPVMVRHLLNYTSGLPSPALEENESIEYLVAHRFDRWAPQQYVDLALRNPKEFEPGEMQNYRNINYIVAGMLIERVTGESYEDEVADRILRPLRLSGKPASYGGGLERYEIPGVGEVWGKTGGWYGYLAGMGGTRDGQRRLTYGLAVNDAKNGDNPSTLPPRIVFAGMTLSAA